MQLKISCTLNEMMGDSVLLQSMLIDLIDNAVKAFAPGSIIRLSAYVDSVPILEVGDIGCGMEDEQKALVCEPFYRVDQARSRMRAEWAKGCRFVGKLRFYTEPSLTYNPGWEREQQCGLFYNSLTTL